MSTKAHVLFWGIGVNLKPSKRLYSEGGAGTNWV